MAVDPATRRTQQLASFETGFWYGLALSPNERTLLGVFTTGGMDLVFVEPTK